MTFDLIQLRSSSFSHNDTYVQDLGFHIVIHWSWEIGTDFGKMYKDLRWVERLMPNCRYLILMQANWVRSVVTLFQKHQPLFEAAGLLGAIWSYVPKN